jgi:hypothetical protein
MDTHDSPAEDLKTFLSDSAREALHKIFDSAYHEMATRWDEEVGCDIAWLRYTVWKFSELPLKQLVKKELHGLHDASEGGQFRIGFGPFVMTPYACGLAAPDDPWKHFPRNDTGAGSLSDINTGQLSLGLVDDFGVKPKIAVVFGHYGDQDTGLNALYLKVPCDQNAGRICQWSYIEQVWRIGSGGTGTTAPTPPSGPTLPAPVKIEKPVLPFKPIKKKDTGA